VVQRLEVLCVIPSLTADRRQMERCLAGVRASLPESSTIVVVWNSLEPFPMTDDEIEIYRPGMNLGYGPAINVATRRYPSEYIWTVQDDMEFPELFVTQFIEALRLDSSLAVITPALAVNGSEMRGKPRGGEISADGNLLPFNEQQTEIPIGQVDFFASGWVPLSGAVVRSSAFDKIGGFDPHFFPVGHSDVDLCWRLNREGYRVGTALNYHAAHEKGASTPGPLGAYLFRENGNYFSRKVRGNELGQSNVDVPLDVLEALATVATIKLIGFARYVQMEQMAPLPAILRSLRMSLRLNWERFRKRFNW